MHRLTLALILCLIAATVPTAAHEIKAGNLVIVHPMVDEADDGQAVSRGSMEIRNEGTTPEKLIGISSEFAAKSEIEGGVPVTIPPHDRASVLMLFRDIHNNLSEDEAYAGELTFEKAGKVKVDLMVHTHKH
jgi:periplasmic copper chaperone A